MWTIIITEDIVHREVSNENSDKSYDRLNVKVEF